MRFNPISSKAIKFIFEALQFNNTLKILRIPNYPDDVNTNIKSTKKKSSHEPHVKLFIDFSTKIEQFY